MGHLEKKLLCHSLGAAAVILCGVIALYFLVGAENPLAFVLVTVALCGVSVAVQWKLAQNSLFSTIRKLRLLEGTEQARKQVEEEIEDTELSPLLNVLREAQSDWGEKAPYEELFMIANQPMIIFNQNGDVLDINHSFEAYTGWSRTENGLKRKILLADLMSEKEEEELLSEDDSAMSVEWKCQGEASKSAIIMTKELRDLENRDRIRCGIVYP